MTTALLVSAAVLGFLAFFEPCTIATHTLFAVRAHRAGRNRCAMALAQLMLVRVVLLAAIFGAVASVGVATPHPWLTVAMLGAIGLVYVVTRKVYLPVPHVEFFRVLPAEHRLSPGLRLGLTLPACTLPLVVIVAVLSALTQRPWIGVLAGMVFGLMFTLPTLWGAIRGLGAGARVFLAKAAAFSPYLTTALLWGAAFWIWNTGV